MVGTGELEGPGNSLVFNPELSYLKDCGEKRVNRHPKIVNQSSLTPVEIECS